MEHAPPPPQQGGTGLPVKKHSPFSWVPGEEIALLSPRSLPARNAFYTQCGRVGACPPHRYTYIFPATLYVNGTRPAQDSASRMMPLKPRPPAPYPLHSIIKGASDDHSCPEPHQRTGAHRQKPLPHRRGNRRTRPLAARISRRHPRPGGRAPARHPHRR